MPKRRVLIVDDEANIRELTRLALETAGYEVGEAASGLEAFAIIGGDDSWDAILLDQKMPGMVGTEILRRLKVMLPAAPVIMMTAYASVELAVEAMKLGATDFVRKPMTPEILRNALAAALAKPAQSSRANLAEDGSSSQVTLNGFTILRTTGICEGLPQRADECFFIVSSPDGSEQEVIVEIDRDVVAAVKKVTNDLTLGKSFLTEQAEQFLSAFLWNDGNVPSNGRLTLKGVDGEALETAASKGSQ